MPCRKPKTICLMSNPFRNITGTFDVLPDPQSSGGDAIAGSRAWQELEAVIRRVMHRYGAREIRTPILEPTELIARGVGQLTDIVSKEMFAFERGDTHYVLRPEVTAPVMRAYLQHNLEQLGGVQRLFYIGPCFRAERPQKGRYRQFHQFGAEFIGADDPRADAETVLMAIDIYRELGLTDFTVRINSIGDAASRPRYREALVEFLTPLADQLSDISRQRLESNPMRILDTKSEKERALLLGAPIITDYIDDESRAHYEAVKAHLTAVGVDIEEDPFLVRGLDYYTRTAFEIDSPVLGAQSTLAGGGRYDLLAEDVGSKKPVPAVGFAAGMERLFLALSAAGTTLPEYEAPDIFVVALGDAAAEWTFSAVHDWRSSGIRAVYDLKGRSMKAQMREANRQQAPKVIIVGDAELEAGHVAVKDMESGEQVMVPLDQIKACILD